MIIISARSRGLVMRFLGFFTSLFFISPGSLFSKENDPMLARRLAMVAQQIEARGVKDARVLAAMRKVPRHRFIPPDRSDLAYEDFPVNIGFGQTISQPYIVAYMTEVLKLKPSDKVLEIGTGSGYQAAVLAELAAEVYTIEIIPELAAQARKTLDELGYKNIHAKTGDGYKGWPGAAPFDAIIVTAAPDEIPSELVAELKVGGRMVVPVGAFFQELKLVTRTEKEVSERSLLPVRFVPMIKGGAK